MDLSPSSLAVLGLASVIGLALFVFGKRQSRTPHMIAGVVLMIYGLVVPGWGLQAAVGVGIIGALWFATRLGF